jgi:selenocysteine-specific elongation factor
MRNIILGTAGHIDHGKSTLVKALTGVDPDRLKEEKERGITIDLGFASIIYPEGLTVGIVDVPGHEKLIKNMLAGAGGIDMLLLVIDAEEGIMPQTREHLAICSLLGISHCIVAITKSDLVEKDWLDMVVEEVRDFINKTIIAEAQIIAVSAVKGHNIDILKEAIKDCALTISPKNISGIFRIPIDRVFSLKGFGTVVTGTAISGSIHQDDIVEILPAGKKSKVRGLHVHDQPVKTAIAGQRVALNVSDLAKKDITRGDVLTNASCLAPTTIIDATVELLNSSPVVKTGQLVHFYTGTAELTGRIVFYNKKDLRPGQKSMCQFRFKNKTVAMAGDRYIIRRFSPLETIGGGAIVDPWPAKRKHTIEELQIFESGTLREKLSIKILTSGISGISQDTLKGWIKTEQEELTKSLCSLMDKGEIMEVDEKFIHKKNIGDFSEKLLSKLKEFHKINPLKPGIPKEKLRSSFKWLESKFFGALLGKIDHLAIDQDIVRLKSFSIKIGDSMREINGKIVNLLNNKPFQPPEVKALSQELNLNPKETGDILQLMTSEGHLVRINDSLYITERTYKELLENLKNFYQKKPDMTVSEFRSILSTSRKYALPFLEYLDSHRITMRVGDVRKLLKKDILEE